MADKKGMFKLARGQDEAVAPTENVWLSASAGTGKTQVLTARVFRLLLREHVDPEQILCLTFTKAGAAEMKERINRQLASWVRMPTPQLRQDLDAIGSEKGEAEQERARTLFAKVLDAPGGGLRIMTIHSFCQSLLASFPEEAEIPALFKPIEERDQKILARQALADLLLAEEQAGRTAVISALQNMSVRMGEEAVEGYLMTCAGKAEAMTQVPENALPFVRRLLNLPIEGGVQEWLAERCEDANIEKNAMMSLAAAMAQSGGKKEQERQLVIFDWLSQTPPQRVENLEALHYCWATKTTGAPPKATKKLAANFPEYEAVTEQLYAWSNDLLETRILFDYAELLAGALTAGKAFSAAYAEAKRIEGVVDFDDMIRMTAQLLQQGNMADWIRYKLDQRTDHILIDEAQDTNQAQWQIVHALADEFFAGKGAGGDRLRTMFTVGDFKQAIFGFQGTSPHNYAAAREEFFAAAHNSGRDFNSLSLDRSFRTTPPVLEVVDNLLTHIGHKTLGLDAPVPRHDSHYPESGGSVTLWQPVAHGEVGNPEDEESWANDETRYFAHQLALQIKAWLSDETPLWLSRENRRLEPKDVMLLVSKRGELSSLIVARLFAEGVPVAGIDRIRLNQPLVVQDMLAAIRFVLQPEDDLNLACLLVSPLIGWSQEQLLERGYRGKDNARDSLWKFLRNRDALAEHIKPLRSMLKMADYNTPYQFLETLMSGAMQGREKLTARLGLSSLDPLEELLNAALAFEQDHLPTLQGFLDWFDRGDVEIKRDAQSGPNEVRLMTVHGAKGLQAPLVILADATFDPDKKRGGGFDIADPVDKENKAAYPAVPIRKAERVKLLDAYAVIADAKAREEHWRLLYVAMTRAEEHLVLAGTLGPATRGEVPAESWYSAVENTLSKMGHDWSDALRWSRERKYVIAGEVKSAESKNAGKTDTKKEIPVPLPDWVSRPAPEERVPPRPLAPSRLGDDDASSAPPDQNMMAAAQRGSIMHSLFEKLPAIATNARANAADTWLSKQKGISAASEREKIIAEVLSIIDQAEWSDLFGPSSIAEAPLAAVVGQKVVSGTVDRLLVTDDQIHVVDFKTGRNVPQSAEQIPSYHIRQMAAYVAALEKIFPGRAVSAGLLYSQGPVLLEIPEAMLNAKKPGLART